MSAIYVCLSDKTLTSRPPSAQAFLRGRQKQANGCRVSAFHFLAAEAGGEAKEAWRLDGQHARFKIVVFFAWRQKTKRANKTIGGPLKPFWPPLGGFSGPQFFFLLARFFFLAPCKKPTLLNRACCPSRRQASLASPPASAAKK